ncbi:MAG: SpoIIE family protein phosphatase [Acidobacteriia bacterium]|nr:SpoIIE family protein phosphatase [Terriglobia bacterium]
MPEKEISSENILEVILPDKSRRTVGIVDSPFLMGRGDESGNHLQLDDPRISRRCAAILTEGKRCLLEDLGHRRGIFVNGNKIDHYVLSDGDVITFGYDDSYEIIFRAAGAERAMQSMLTLIGGVSAKDNPSTGLGKLNLLLEATSLLHSDLPLDSVIGTMLDFAVSITHADRGLLLEADSSGALQVRLARGTGGVALPAQGLSPSQTALRKAMAQESAVITEDLNLADTAFRGAQSIVAQSLRAVIAIPLHAVSRAAAAGAAAGGAPGVAGASGRGQFLGMLYLDSRRASAFSKLDRQILDALAVEAASILDNARLVERERQRQRLEQELNIARDIQQALLPRGFHDLPYLRVAGIHTPCHAVGGDYFDVFPLSEDRTAILVADVSGKGLGAALLTTMLQGALSGMSNTTDPVQVLNHLNRFLCSHSEVGRYATMFFSILDRNGQLLFINAGHPSPLIIRCGEVLDLLTEGSFPVGLVPQAEFTATTTNLQPGDTLALFSDGVTEAMDPQEELYGVPRLREVLAGRHDQPLDHLQKTVLESIQKFTRGASQNDDITLLLVRYQAPEPGAAS